MLFPYKDKVLSDTGSLRVSEIVKMHMIKLQKMFKIIKQVPEKSGLATAVLPTKLMVQQPALGAICA